MQLQIVMQTGVINTLGVKTSECGKCGKQHWNKKAYGKAQFSFGNVLPALPLTTSNAVKVEASLE